MPIPGGFVLRPRCISNSELATAPPYVRELWDLIVREANHKSAKYNGFIISRGQLFRSYMDLQEKLHWYIGWRKVMYTKDHMKKAMKFLRSRGMITTKKAPGGVLITICKYDYYQSIRNYESTNESTIESTIEAPLKHQESTIYNKKEKKKNNKTNNKYMSELKNSDNMNVYLKIALKFWELFRKQHGELNLINENIEKAECLLWINPIKHLMEVNEKSIQEFEEVYLYLKENEFWEGRIDNIDKLTQKYKGRQNYFDFFLREYRKKNTEYKLLEKEELEPVLKKHFKKVTPHFLETFDEYQLMTFNTFSKILKGKTLEIEINKLAKLSGKESIMAVNILKNSIEKQHEISPL